MDSWTLQTAQSDLVSLLEDRVDDVEDEEREQNPSVSRIIGHAILFLIAGGAVAAFFADPLVGAISGFSATSGISPFFISFVVTPLATSSSEAISSLMFARRKRRRNISMSYCQVRPLPSWTQFQILLERRNGFLRIKEENEGSKVLQIEGFYLISLPLAS